MKDDAVLIREYVEAKSEGAFAEIVRRHIDMVYATALRRTDGDRHRSADVAQQVFTTLAQKAAHLHIEVLGAWLHTATRNAALNLMISERRRQTREREAATLDVKATSTPTEWGELRPVLDDAIDDLPDADRAAIVLRFLEKKRFAEVGAALLISEDAARMRTDRAVDKLRVQLVRRGITSTAAALTKIVGAQPAVLAPTWLAGSVTSESLAAAGITGGLGTALPTAVSVASINAKLIFLGGAAAAVIFAVVYGLKHRSAVDSGPAPAAVAEARPSQPDPAAQRYPVASSAEIPPTRVPADPPIANPPQVFAAVAPSGTPVAIAPASAREIKIIAGTNNEMKFDQDALTAAPGETIRLTLTNAGTQPKMVMGHNWVLLRPNVDMTDFALSASADAGSGYIPAEFARGIVAFTKLLGPGESDTIIFQAPAEPGDYAYLCSFPGHFGTMKGVLTVRGTAVASAAPAPANAAPAVSNPPATTPPASASKSSSPDLAKAGATGFSRNWSVEELFRAANLALNRAGRNFPRGEKLFEVTGCGLCHHFGGGVGGIGPDLSGVGGKFGAREILESIIEPSAVVSDLYGTVRVYTDDNKSYVGKPAGTTDTSYQLIATPSIDPATGTMSWIGPVISIPNDKIVEIEESGISPMPPGLINGLTEDEIYDFLAFLISVGNPQDKMFGPVKPDAPLPPRIVAP